MTNQLAVCSPLMWPCCFYRTDILNTRSLTAFHWLFCCSCCFLAQLFSFSDCPLGTFGTNCAQNCSCGLGAARCDTTTGCVCQDGWTGRRCESDVNECDVNSVQQECQAKQAMCVNTPGGYRCQCLQGYAMDNTGKCQGKPD